MPRDPIPTWYFVIVVVRLGRRFLLVHEKKHGQLWFLPAGRVEPGETYQEAAKREVLEEAGIQITLEGLLRVEHTPFEDGNARVRFILVARPDNDMPIKSDPDEESLGAAWVTLDELGQYPLRDDEVRHILQYIQAGAAIYPLNICAQEGIPYPLYF